MFTRYDYSRYLSDKITELFRENLKQQRKEEYKEFTTPKKSTKDEEIYDSIGNLSSAQEKTEGGSLHYEGLTQMFQTTVVNKTYDRGFFATWEAVEDDVEKVINSVNTGGMMRAMISKREQEAAAIVDGVFTAVGADGVAYAASNHPLDTSKTAKVNNNLMTAGAITHDNIDTGIKMFNSIYDYAGNLFDTKADSILCHANQQTNVNSVLQSNLKSDQMSNNKNTLPMLKTIFGRYINQYYWHLLDTSLDSFIMQRRSGLEPIKDQDKINTLNFYWAMVERYRMAIINPGLGIISNPYTGV